MNRYEISVETRGTEYYTIDANSEEEAIELIKQGEGYLQSDDTEWYGDFDTARAEKEAKQLVDKKLDKQFLIDHNIEVGSTQALRRKAIVEYKLEQLKLSQQKEKQDEDG